MSRRREKDRQSGTGRNDRQKRGGHKTWGVAGSAASTGAPLDKNDPNYTTLFLDSVQDACDAGANFSLKQTTNLHFQLGLQAGFRAQQQGAVCGVWVGEGNAHALAGGGAGFEQFKSEIPEDLAEMDNFLRVQGVSSNGGGCVFVASASEADSSSVALLREALLVTQVDVVDLGELEKHELGHCVDTWNSGETWKTREEFDEVVSAAPVPTASTGESKVAAAAPAIPSAGAPAASDVEDQYKIYDDDKALGKAAPALTSLKLLHFPEGVDAVDSFNYGDYDATVICFWGKLFKGSYPTINLWADYAASAKYAGRVRFVGVSRDSAEKDVLKYISRIGNDMPELGENGIILSGGIPLAFDADSQVNAAFKDILQVKSLGVDHAFVVDSEGIIRWRTLFNRGKEPSGQFGVQLDHILAGEDVDKVFGPTPVEDDDDDDDEEEEAADQSKASSIAAMACDDY